MRLSIAAVGIATAQGNTKTVLDGRALEAPQPWPWPANRWTTSSVCRPVSGLDPSLTGLTRWQAILTSALTDCFGEHPPARDTPVFLGSCNGAIAGFDLNSWCGSFASSSLLTNTPWSGKRIPVFSSSCNSGLHALYAATLALASGASEAVVIAADILSESNQNNFEGLRVLADSVAPWLPSATGFILGEAAVVLRLTRDPVDDGHTYLTGPLLRNDLVYGDGLRDVVALMSSTKPALSPKLIIGQGTGPARRDERELATFQIKIDPTVPITTPLLHFGHTLGASGLLSVALASLAIKKQESLAAFHMAADWTSDGRPLGKGSVLSQADNILITSEAFDGSCVGVGVSSAAGNNNPPSNISWRQSSTSDTLMHPILRRIGEDALSHRPSAPPDLLMVTVEEPLAPSPEAWFGERLLPSAVLEITPGFISQLVARTWGFSGPAVCLVGDPDTQDGPSLKTICEELDLTVAEVSVVGTGGNREIIWRERIRREIIWNT